MPFLAYQHSEGGSGKELVVPEEVSDAVDVECPSCGGRMRPRGGGSNQRARHFFHLNRSESRRTSECSGVGEQIAESERHRVMKSLAVSGLRRRFDGRESIEQCATEVPVDVSSGQGRTTARRADARIEFETRNLFFGEGVIVEVQHANETKNIPQVTADYLNADHSVFWADETCFSDDELRLDRFDQAFEEDSGIAFTPYSYSPSKIWNEFDPSRWFSPPKGWQFDDPNSSCTHEFESNGEEARCALCGTKYQLHSESQFPMYAPADKHRNHFSTVTYVSGADEALNPDGTPHVHVWSLDRHGRNTTISKCSRCQAMKISTRSETKIDYNAHFVEELETPQMKHCDHEWRRTGSGEECWKCGKTKSDRGMGF